MYQKSKNSLCPAGKNLRHSNSSVLPLAAVSACGDFTLSDWRLIFSSWHHCWHHYFQTEDQLFCRLEAHTFCPVCNFKLRLQQRQYCRFTRKPPTSKLMKTVATFHRGWNQLISWQRKSWKTATLCCFDPPICIYFVLHKASIMA